MQQPSAGRIVHYVLPEHYPNGGQIRPAMIIRPWTEIIDDPHSGMCNITVFLDGANDIAISSTGLLSVGSVYFDASGAPGTWHWPVLGKAATVTIVHSEGAR